MSATTEMPWERHPATRRASGDAGMPRDQFQKQTWSTSGNGESVSVFALPPACRASQDPCRDAPTLGKAFRPQIVGSRRSPPRASGRTEGFRIHQRSPTRGRRSRCSTISTRVSTSTVMLFPPEDFWRSPRGSPASGCGAGVTGCSMMRLHDGLPRGKGRAASHKKNGYHCP